MFNFNISFIDMRILVSNDDGYTAKGLQTLIKILKPYGELTVVAPKYHQSGMSMAVSIGLKRIAHKDMGLIDGVRWHYLDATPASCVKFGADVIFEGNPPDLVVSGINHGNNAASAACYSGTLGAAAEGALAGIPSIGVSLDDQHLDADFSAVEALLPGILDKLLKHPSGERGLYYNINFPRLPQREIKGVRRACQGATHWEKEFDPWDPSYLLDRGVSAEAIKSETDKLGAGEPGEVMLMMSGDLRNTEGNRDDADNLLLAKGYITIVPHNIDCTSYGELDRLGAYFS